MPTRTKLSDEPVETPEEPEPEPEQPEEPSEARKAFLAGELSWRDYVAAENHSRESGAA